MRPLGMCLSVPALLPGACAEPPLPSRCCPRGPTCRASAAPTAGATEAASKPEEGSPSAGATTGGSRRGCEGGRTGEAGGCPGACGRMEKGSGPRGTWVWSRLAGAEG